MPDGSSTPPTPPSQSPPPTSPLLSRVRAVAHLRPVSIPDIVRDMAGKDPKRKLADFELLCDAMTCRVEDGDASAENWKDSSARALAPDRFWNQTMASMIASDDAGPCLGIELNIWERAKVSINFIFLKFLAQGSFCSV